ncbi:uncharacterized protein LAESUDRAFT_665895 [Laetiporus sulphureus 93-53]|uniref:Uncharacterized protein n=1 Tax=Laetiporus sulphureus 93-53 TaxID=1314785 RepID=A0A165B9C4_9APHY|nr:uncharacterized protein LAESUDRAFT_665895 [Laetiporus sulphureus 93-53]KZT00545.1 hypothetical protein LAESUDRAFT_665895 [Laetiporus sulphureus 93-53]
MTQHHLDEAIRYIHYQEGIITGLQNELKALTINHQDAVELLNTRTAELHAAQTFLSKTDTVSDSEIRQAIERLNAEIHQIAAAVSDSIPYSSDKGQNVSLSQRTLDNLAAILGKPLFERLKAVAADDEAIVQIALQARISRFASNYLQSFGNFDENNKALRSVWQSIRGAETQSVSGRWRALARQHAKKVPEFNNPSPVKLRKALAARIIEVVKSTGIQEDLNGLSWQLQERFGSKLDAIVQLILSIQKTILEDVIAYDFHPIIAYPGHPFDGTLMEDEFEDRSEGSKDKAGPALCAVALGLTRNEMVMEDGQPVERRTIVLKTKVAMECVLKEFEQSE